MQLNEMDVMTLLYPAYLNLERMWNALGMVNLTEEKWDHTPKNPHLKGRSCMEDLRRICSQKEIHLSCTAPKCLFISVTHSYQLKQSQHSQIIWGAFAFKNEEPHNHVNHMRIGMHPV